MFHRIVVEEWQRWLNALGILLFLLVFISTVIGVLRMPKESVQHLESLPLNDDAPTTHDESH
jgi:cbb3-type cytochrome oxidase subunit 3